MVIDAGGNAEEVMSAGIPPGGAAYGAFQRIELEQH